MLVIALVVISACVGLTPKHDYMTSRREFTLTLTKYNDWYDVQTPEKQAEWKAKFDPLFIAADDALKTWKTALDSGTTSPAAEQRYLKMKGDLLAMLVKAGVIVEE
jgi:hypothetical protein